MTSLANRGTTDLAEYDYSGLDLPSDGNEDIKPAIPVVKLTQATSAFVEGASRHAGEFWHSDWEAFTKTLDGVVLMKRDTRAKFAEDQMDSPVCASDDGIVPRPNQPLWEGKVQPRACADCVFSQWGPNGETPECPESYALLIDRNPSGDEPELAQFRIGGMSRRPYEQFVSKKLRGNPIYTQKLSISTQEKSKPGKKWYEMVIVGEPLKRDEVVRNIELVTEARKEWQVRHESNATPDTTWGDGKESFAGHRTPPVDADGVIQERRTPTPSPLSRTAAEMFPKYEPMEGVLPFDE